MLYVSHKLVINFVYRKSNYMILKGGLGEYARKEYNN